MEPSKIGGGQRKLKGGQPWKTGAVVCQCVATIKEAVPPPPHPPTSSKFGDGMNRGLEGGNVDGRGSERLGLEY